MPKSLLTASNKNVEKKQLLFKILIIGDVGTGKSSIVRRYVHNIFNQYYKATVGVDFALKLLVWDVDMLIRLQLWDISGQDRFGNMTRVYYKESHGAMIVFDPTRHDTYDGALRWKADLDNKVNLADGKPVPSALLANKCDIENDLTEEKLNEYCQKEGFIGGFRTSAKENIGIVEAFKFLTDQIIEREKEGQYEVPFLQRDGNVRKIDLTSTFRPKYDGEATSRCCT